MTLTLAATQSVAGLAGTGSAITYTMFGDELSGSPLTDAFKVLAQGTLGTSAATLYTATGVQALVRTVSLKNVTAGAVTVAMFINGTAGTNQIWSATIPANGAAWYEEDGWKVYDSSGFLQYVGATGPTGLQGPTGSTGSQGPQGNPGVITTVTAGTGLTGGGSASTVTVNAVANADGSIIANADDLQVGVLATDAQHGNRGGGGIHAAVTQSANGFMIASDKKLIDDLHYDVVADYGWIGNDSNDNGAGAGGATAFSTIMTNIPTGARLFHPAGTYRTSVELTINVDKRITFCGAGRYASIIKTTSATANIYNKSVAGWYDAFCDLGFQSTVTKTAGAAIAITSGNSVGMNCYRLWITGIFIGIDANGAQSGNLSVWNDLDISGVPNGGRGIRINGSTINVQIHNATINAGAATTSACCEINQSGAVQVTSCDWIQGTNVLLINSTTAAGPQACYFTNVFFDQPQGSVIKIMGTNTANRIKFTQCGIAPTGNNHGVEINGTGAGAVGTQTALPAGLSFVDCDIYCAVGTGTGAGIMVNGCQDVNIQSCRITGFNGSGGCGVSVIPSAANMTKVRVNGCILGPNSNLTVTNETGVKLVAGSSALAQLSITDNSMIGCGTAITDTSTILAPAQKSINNNVGAANGLSAGNTAPGTTLTTTTETVYPGMQLYFPANSIKVGTTIDFKVMDSLSATSTTIIKARFGANGTTADATNGSATTAASGAAANVIIIGTLAFTSVGATAAFVMTVIVQQAAAAVANITATITGTVNTTTGNWMSLTIANGTANTRTYRGGSMLCVSPA